MIESIDFISLPVSRNDIGVSYSNQNTLEMYPVSALKKYFKFQFFISFVLYDLNFKISLIDACTHLKPLPVGTKRTTKGLFRKY